MLMQDLLPMNELIAFYIGMTTGCFLLLAVLLIVSAMMRETWWYTYGFSRPAIKKGGIEVDLICTTEEKILVKVNPKTSAENPSAIEGIPAVSVVSGDGTFEMIDDRSFWVKSGQTEGTTTFAIKADADLGPGVKDIGDTINLNVVPAMAVSLGLVAEAPVPK